MGAGGLVLSYWAPAVLILPTFLRHPPQSIGRWCRWRAAAPGQVAITFDDGPSPDTSTTLRILDELEMRATFFVLGEQFVKHPDLVHAMAERGHEVATHGWSHRSALRSSPIQIRRDLERAIRLHEEELGRKPRFYRPPYGHISAATLREVSRQTLELVLWSDWGREFAETVPSKVLTRLAGGVEEGAVVLLHDNDVSCRAGTAALTHAVLPGVKELLTQRSLRAVPLGALLGAGEERAPSHRVRDDALAPLPSGRW
jgi:peptidoglycan/xylan/chitin deacetylase (PgdA/CDA1 family)